MIFKPYEFPSVIQESDTRIEIFVVIEAGFVRNSVLLRTKTKRR